MNKEQAKNKIETLEKEIEELKEIINKEDEGHWKPKVEEEYYYICTYGGVSCTYNNKCNADNEIISIGNYFKTQEEAEDMIKFKKIMNKYCYRFSVDELKDASISKYYIYFNCNYNDFMVDFDKRNINSQYYFNTRENAQKAIKELTPELFLSCVGK